MQPKTIHPIDDNPLIQAYQIRNYELGILAAHNSDIMPWFYNKHINCVYMQEKNRFDHLMYDDRWYANEGVMAVHKMRFKKSISEVDSVNMLNIAREMIFNGYYFMGYFDEYHISCKKAYQKRHFRHTSLIYGFNDDEKLFYAIAYNANRKYERFEFPYSAFIKSIEVNYDDEKEYVKSGAERVDYDFVKPNKDFVFKINIPEIYANLFDYVHSINSRTAFAGLVYGLECMKAFVKYIESVIPNDANCDVRYSRLFMELKNLMLLRIDYLEKHGYIKPGILEEYKKISDKQTNIHNLFVKYNISRQESIIDRLIKMQEEIIGLENIVLLRFLDELKEYLKSEHLKKYR